MGGNGEAVIILLITYGDNRLGDTFNGFPYHPVRYNRWEFLAAK